MARANYSIGLKLNDRQTLLGWLYLPFYLHLTSLGLQYLAALLQYPLTDFLLNILYFSVNLVFVLAVFGRFLLKSLRGFTQRFWPFIQTVILGFALYYCATLALTRLTELLAGNLPNFNDRTVEGYISQGRSIMLVASLIAVPIVEEVLVRAVVFGSLHRTNRILAHIVSALLFCFMHVWQYASQMPLLPLLLTALQYAPAAVALGWTYEKSGTIWASIALHAIINAIAFGVSVLL